MIDDDILDDELTHDESPAGATLRTATDIVDLILGADGAWQPAETLALGAAGAWKFDLASPGRNAVLHVHLADVLRRYILDRLHSAKELGYEIHVALALEALYESEVQTVLAELDAHIHLIDGADVQPPEHHLDSLTHHQVAVSPTARTAIGRANWRRRHDGTNQQKGRYFESLLAFLFEQVPDFRVVERNYRGDSDEVDIWLQIASWSTRCWQENGVPFILVEGKNREESAGAPFVIHIKGQLREKRRRTRIGILCSTSTFSRDANIEVVKLAESEYSVALLGPDELEAWIESPNPDDYLESQVRKAMIR
jgi:hypothetical protein